MSEEKITPGAGVRFVDLAANRPTQVMVKGHLPADGSEIRFVDLARSIKEKEPGWGNVDPRGFGRMFADMWKNHHVMKRTGIDSGSYFYSRHKEDVVSQEQVSPMPQPPVEDADQNGLGAPANPPLLTEQSLTGLRFGDWPEEPGTASEVVTDQSPEEASVTADYGSTFAVLWIACPSGEFIPAHLDFGNLGFADRSGLNQFIEEMVFREHAVPVSIKRGVAKFGGCKLTQKGKEYLVQFWDPSRPPATSPSDVAVVEPTEPPRSELKLPTSPTEQNTLITELQRQLEELKQSLVAAQAARIIDALRGQPTSIAQACLIEAGRQLGLDLVPRPLV